MAIETGASSQSPLVGRLHPDAAIARHAAFALFALVYLEATGLMERHLTDGTTREANDASDPLLVEAIGAAVTQVIERNAHLLCFFLERSNAAALDEIDPAAARELIGWAAAQRVEREETQIAYELGMLALGVELPGILVGSLRELDLHEDSTVAELPDGSGYPTVFLATLHPEWDAAALARLFVEGNDAEQLAAWALVLLSRELTPAAGRIVRVSAASHAALLDSHYDVALVYNPVSWLDGAAGYRRTVRAEQVVLL